MANQYRKILLSGSNAHVAQVTASSIPQATDNNTILFADSNGKVRTLSALTYNSSNDSIEFAGGTFSGSFDGDGSNLNNVTANLGSSLIDGAGVKGFSFNGSAGATASLDLYTHGGLVFYDNTTDSGNDTGDGTHTHTLGLSASLAGNGLEFQGSNNYSKLKIELDGTSDGTSGLGLSSNGLRLSDNLAGQGLNSGSASNYGILNVQLASNGGLIFDSSEIQLNTGLAGNGLNWATEHSVLEIDPAVVVTSSNTITFVTSSNITAALTSDGTIVQTNGGSGSRAQLIHNPVLALNLSDTLEGNFIFNDDVTIAGNLLVEGTNISASFNTQNLNIADQFILLNSGSTTGDGGLAVQSNAADKAAFIFYDQSANRWGVSSDSVNMNTTTHEITSIANAALVTVQIVTDNEATIVASSPLFGDSSADNSLGQLKLTSSPSTNESGVFIYA